MKRSLPIGIGIVVVLLAISRITSAGSTRAGTHAAATTRTAPRRPAGLSTATRMATQHDGERGAGNPVPLAPIPRRRDRHRPGVRAGSARRRRGWAHRADDL